MLNAIVIYDGAERAKTDKAKKLKCVCKRSSAIFADNEYAGLDASVMNLPEKLLENRMHSFTTDTEYHYFMKSQSGHIIALSSKKKITTNELTHLFLNINYILVKPDIVKVSLENVLINPFGYTGRDILAGKVEAEIDGIKQIMWNNLEKVMDRGQRLEELQAKTLVLEQTSIDFVNRTKKLNACC